VPIQASALLLIAPLLAAAAVALRRYLGGSEDSTAMERAPSNPAGSQRPARAAEGAATLAVAPEHAFVLFLAFTALLLLFGTEWVFIRDLFNNRMNTVFKLYYQAWTLLAVVAAYAVYYLLGRLPRLGSPRIGAFAWGALCVVSVAAALVYVPASISSRVNEGSLAPTLDGTTYLAVRDPGDYAAIQWLRESVVGTPTIVEASGGSYTEAGRVSANTGLPTLLGWEFHEQQWRGTFEEASRRAAIVQQIYQSQDRVAVSRLLDEYNVVYVYVGPLENETYGAQDPSALTKFSDFMVVVYNEGGVVIYRTKG
jgi:YYY domain-containing protein